MMMVQWSEWIGNREQEREREREREKGTDSIVTLCIWTIRTAEQLSTLQMHLNTCGDLRKLRSQRTIESRIDRVEAESVLVLCHFFVSIFGL